MITRILRLLILVSLTAGCASTYVNHYTMSNPAARDKERKCDNGIRYYESACFILVYSLEGKYQSQVLFLPDTSTIHSADSCQFLASSSMNLTLKDGVLTKAENSADATAVVKAAEAAAIMAVTGAIGGPAVALGAGAGAATTAVKDKVGSNDGNAATESVMPPVVENKAPPYDFNNPFPIEQYIDDVSPRIYMFRLGYDKDDKERKPVLYGDNMQIPIDPAMYLRNPKLVPASQDASSTHK